jgi:hypothetical protein
MLICFVRRAHFSGTSDNLSQYRPLFTPDYTEWFRDTCPLGHLTNGALVFGNSTVVVQAATFFFRGEGLEFPFSSSSELFLSYPRRRFLEFLAFKKYRCVVGGLKIFEQRYIINVNINVFAY